MSGLFGKTKKPPKVRDVPVPDRSDAEVQQAAEEQRRQIASSTRASTWLTGGLGVPRGSQTYAASRLLGGGN